MDRKIEVRGAFLIQNNQLLSVSEFYAFDSTTIIYEVIRIIDGVPIFIEEHIARLKSSCREMKLEVDWKHFNFEAQIKLLVKQNQFYIGNVMIQLIQDQSNIVERLFFISHNYPSEILYENGVKLGLLQAERSHPNAKVVLPNLRERANRFIEENNLFEVLLVDKHDNITEASRANFFFIKDEKLVTSPLNTVLKGITLLKVLQLAKQLQIEVMFKQVSVFEIDEYDAAFITGTSPKLLPVSFITNIPMDVQNSILVKLMSTYDELIEAYANSKK